MTLAEKIAKLPRWKIEASTLWAVGGGFGAASGCGGVPYYVLIVPLILSLFLERKKLFALWFSLLIVLTVSLIRQNEKAEDEAEYSISRRWHGVLTVHDTRATAYKGLEKISMLRCRFQGEGMERSIDVLARLPEDMSGGVIYGDHFEVDAVLNVPETPGILLSDDGTTGILPPPYGENYLLRVKSSSRLPGESGILRSFALLREKLLPGLLCGIKERDNQAMAARFLAGASEGVPSAEKGKFVLAGIIHLFAISGLHVGIMAVFVSLLVRFLPLKWRCLTVAAVTAVYCCCTGLAVPAVRAGILVAGFCLLRMFLFYTPAWNWLSYSFFGLMVVSPESVSDLGVQYSYGITAVLIQGLMQLNTILREYRGNLKFIPEFRPEYRLRRRKLKLRNRLITALMVAVLAFMAHSMLTLYRQHIFNPGSIAANLLTALVTPLFFGILFVKILLGSWSWWLGNLASWCLDALETVAEVSSELSGNIPAVEPQWWLLVLFYLSFAGILYFRNIRAVIGCAAAALIFMVIPLFQVSWRDDEVMILATGSGSPPVKIYLPAGSSRAKVCDLPDNWSAVLAADALRRRGCDEADVYYSANYSRFSKGSAAFARRIRVKQLFLPEKPNRFFLRNISENGKLLFPTALIQEHNRPRTGEDGSFNWHFAGNKTFFITSGDNGLQVSIKGPEDSAVSRELPWSNQVLLWYVTAMPRK